MVGWLPPGVRRFGFSQLGGGQPCPTILLVTCRSVGATVRGNGEAEPRRRGKPTRKTFALAFHGEGLGAYQVVFPALSALEMACERPTALRHGSVVYFSWPAASGES